MEQIVISTAKPAPAWPKSLLQQKYRFRARFSSQTLRLTSTQPPLVLRSPGFMSPSKRGCKDHHGHRKLQHPSTLPGAATSSLSVASALSAATRKLWLNSCILPSPDWVMPPGFLKENLKTCSDLGDFGLGMLNTQCSVHPPMDHPGSASLCHGQRSSSLHLVPKAWLVSYVPGKGEGIPKTVKLLGFGKSIPQIQAAEDMFSAWGITTP